MSNLLFNAVQEGHDGKGRIVFVCEDPQGFYCFKPATGFKTKHWKKQTDKKLTACFKRQISCTQNTGFFDAGEAPAKDENYEMAAPKRIVEPAANENVLSEKQLPGVQNSTD